MSKQCCQFWKVTISDIRVKRKSEVCNTFKVFKALMEKQTGKKLKIFRTDKGGEFFPNEIINFCESEGIHHQSTQSYTPQQNGVAERYNRTIEEKGRCMMFDAGLPKNFWAEACNMAAYVINKSVNTSSGDATDLVR